MGGGFVRGVEDWLFGAYAERMGEESRGGERQPCRRSAGCAGEAEGAGAGNPGTAPGERDPAQGLGLFCDGGARPPTEMMLGFIERQEHGVEPICKVLPIAPSTWRRHAARAADPAKLPARAQRDAGLKSGGCLRRISRSMGCARCGGSCNARASRWRAARLMREMGLRGAI